jgi:hypothetical protein
MLISFKQSLKLNDGLSFAEQQAPIKYIINHYYIFMLTDNEKYNVIRKPERNRIVGDTLIKSYGKFEIHNKKMQQIMKFIIDKNKQYNDKIPNQTIKQKALNTILKQQIDLYRLKILYENYQRITDEEEKKSTIQEILLYFTGFRNWCGAGTEIYEQIKQDNDNPSRMFKIDKICRDHDIAFTHAKTIQDQLKADEIFMYEIIQKYILDTDKSMLGVNPNSFQTWSDGFNTIMSYAMSSIEAVVAASVIKQGFKTVYNAGKATTNIIMNPIQSFETVKNVGYTLAQTSKELLRTANKATKFAMRQPAGVYIPPSLRTPTQYLSGLTKRTGLQLYYTLNELAGSINPEIQKFLLTAGFTTIIKDKILAVGALGMIGLKYLFDNIVYATASPEMKYYFEKKGVTIPIVSDEVSEEDMKNIIKMFEMIQNQILIESSMPQMKTITEDDYNNIQITDNPEILINDFKDIYMMQNQNITTKFDRLSEEPEPEYTEEVLTEATTLYDAMLKNPEEVIDKITNYVYEIPTETIKTEKNMEQKEEQKEKTDINDDKEFLKWYFAKELPETTPETTPETVPETIPEINDDEEFLEWYFAKELE